MSIARRMLALLILQLCAARAIKLARPDGSLAMECTLASQ